MTHVINESQVDIVAWVMFPDEETIKRKQFNPHKNFDDFGDRT